MARKHAREYFLSAVSGQLLTYTRWSMDITYTHCAGLDMHKKSVVVCCLTPGGAGELLSETRTARHDDPRFAATERLVDE